MHLFPDDLQTLAEAVLKKCRTSERAQPCFWTTNHSEIVVIAVKSSVVTSTVDSKCLETDSILHLTMPAGYKSAAAYFAESADDRAGVELHETGLFEPNVVRSRLDPYCFLLGAVGFGFDY